MTPVSCSIVHTAYYCCDYYCCSCPLSMLYQIVRCPSAQTLQEKRLMLDQTTTSSRTNAQTWKRRTPDHATQEPESARNQAESVLFHSRKRSLLSHHAASSRRSLFASLDSNHLGSQPDRHARLLLCVTLRSRNGCTAQIARMNDNSCTCI
jgi:hypothetical protein